MLIVAVINVDAYPFWLSQNFEDSGIGVFLFHCAI